MVEVRTSFPQLDYYGARPSSTPASHERRAASHADLVATTREARATAHTGFSRCIAAARLELGTKIGCEALRVASIADSCSVRCKGLLLQQDARDSGAWSRTERRTSGRPGLTDGQPRAICRTSVSLYLQGKRKPSKSSIRVRRDTDGLNAWAAPAEPQGWILREGKHPSGVLPAYERRVADVGP
jgi:hypothetical protein